MRRYVAGGYLGGSRAVCVPGGGSSAKGRVVRSLAQLESVYILLRVRYTIHTLVERGLTHVSIVIKGFTVG